MALRDLTSIQSTPIQPPAVVEVESAQAALQTIQVEQVEIQAGEPSPVAVTAPTIIAPAAQPLSVADHAVIDALTTRIFDLDCNEIRIVGQDPGSDLPYHVFFGIGTRYYEASSEILLEDEAQMRRVLNHFILPNTTNDALDGSEIGVYTKGKFFLKEGREERTARVQIFLPPVTPRVSVNFQLLSKQERDLEDLVGEGTMSLNIAAFLKFATLAGASIVFSGIPGAGKTTAMGACIQEIPNVDPTGHNDSDPSVVPEFILCMQEIDEIPMHRVLYKQKFYTFEEAAQVVKHRVEGMGGSMSDLVDISKVARGYRAVFGECRGPEMYDYLEAASIFAGCMTTMHARSANQAVANAVQFAMRNDNARVAGLEGVRQLVASGVDLVVHLEKWGDRRVVTEILELDGSVAEGEPRSQRLFLLDRNTGEWVRPNGSGMSERPGRLLSKLQDNGLPNLHANPIG